MGLLGFLLKSKLIVLPGAPDVSLPKLFLLNTFSKLVIICDYLEEKKGHVYLKKNLFSKNYGTVERRKHAPYPSTEI